MEHFEQLWESAEIATKQFYSDPTNIIIGKIKAELDNLINLQDQNDKIECVGRILLDLCYISDKLNINTYAALKNQLDDLKLKIFDPDQP
jgi:hypothetical protein